MQLYGDEKDNDAKRLYIERIGQHRDDAIGVALLLMSHPDWMTTTEEKEFLISLGDDVKSDFRVQKMLERLMKLQPSDVGDKFLDFAVEYDGKTTRLSDYYFEQTLRMLRFTVLGLIAAAALMLIKPTNFIDPISWLIFGIVACCTILPTFAPNKVTNLISHPILLILLAGLAGYCIYG